MPAKPAVKTEETTDTAESTFRAFEIERDTQREEVRATSWDVIPDADEEAVAWTVTSMEEEEETVPVSTLSAQNPRHVWREVRGELLNITGKILEEGERQYASGINDGILLGKGVAGTLKGWGASAKQFLVQPVWVPGRHNQPKQHSRGTLFFLDIFRFGGTFASLFVALFFALNYQSFWAIAMAKIDPVTDITTGKELASEMSATLDGGIADAGNNGGSLLAFLPPVGPPENRIVIPKLGLNVPIVIPPVDALLKEDWTKLEEDIQAGLQNGVVHYPGTANPGQAGNFFVTGHSSYFPWAPGKYKSVFARLHELNVGDEYWVFYGGDKFRYVVTDEKEINPSDVTALDQPVNKRISSLMTCTPVGTTLRRLIITAQEVDPVTGQPLDVGEHQTEIDLPKINLQMLPI